ncbi:MAG: phage tail length tape measure family protein [Microbacterium sp.]
MSVAEQANLVVAISLRDQFSPSVKRLQTNLKTLDMQTAQLQQGIGKIGQGLAKGFKTAAVGAGVAVGFLAVQVKAGIDSLVELERTTDQTNRILEGLGKRTNITAEQVRDLSVALEEQTAVDDKLIQRGINLGLQFGKLRKNQLEPFAETALDISEATGTDATGAFKALGAALSDPERRLAALDRTTKAFSAKQIEQIQNLAKQNRLSEAQARILGILNQKFGGAASRGQDSYRKNTARLNDAIEDLQMNLAAPLLRPLTRLTRQLAAFAQSEDVRQGLTDLGNGLASLFSDENINAGVGTIRSGFAFLRDLPWNSIKDGLQTTADVAKRAVDLFKSLPPEVQGGLVTLLAANKLTGGLVASGLGDIASFLLRNLTTINAAVVNVVGAKVNDGTGGDAPGVGGGVKGNAGGGFGTFLRGLPLIGLAFELEDRKNELSRKLKEAEFLRNTIFRSGIITGVPGLTPGLKPEITPRQQAADQFAGTQALIRAILGSGPQASPGGGGQRVQMQVIDKLTTLAALGDKQNEQASNIWERLGQGNITYQEANRRLNRLIEEGKATTTAIENQKTEVNLAPQINISAAQTGNAITLAATGSRIVIR